MISLKRIVEQQDSTGQYYDLGKDFANFKRSIDGTFEQVKSKFEAAIGSKLAGKRVRARASRGYKQYVKDYEFDITKITIDDYYDNYVVVAQDNTTPKPKEYFLKPGFKVTILGPATGQPSPQKGGKPQGDETPRAGMPMTNNAEQPSQKMALAPVGNTPSERPLKEDGSNGYADAYSIDAIVKDIKDWLPTFLKKPETSPRDFVRRLGWIKSAGKGKTKAIFDITIPDSTVRIKFTPDIMNKIVGKLGNKEGTIQTRFEVKKMEHDDVKDEWNIRLTKTMTDTTANI